MAEFTLPTGPGFRGQPVLNPLAQGVGGFVQGIREGLGIRRGKKEALADRRSKERIAAQRLGRETSSNLFRTIGDTAKSAEATLSGLRGEQKTIERNLGSISFTGDREEEGRKITAIQSEINRISKGASAIRAVLPGITSFNPAQQRFLEETFSSLTSGTFRTNKEFRDNLATVQAAFSRIPGSSKAGFDILASLANSGVRLGNTTIFENDPVFAPSFEVISEEERKAISMILSPDLLQVPPR